MHVHAVDTITHTIPITWSLVLLSLLSLYTSRLYYIHVYTCINKHRTHGKAIIGMAQQSIKGLISLSIIHYT